MDRAGSVGGAESFIEFEPASGRLLGERLRLYSQQVAAPLRVGPTIRALTP